MRFSFKTYKLVRVKKTHLRKRIIHLKKKNNFS